MLLETNTAKEIDKKGVEELVDTVQVSTNADVDTYIINATDKFQNNRIKIEFRTRVFEVVFASIALLISLPVMFFTAVIIKFGTSGAVLFRQSRVGLGRKLFPFIKFRTMYVDARERFPELYTYQYTPQDMQELKFKVENDPRVTPQGEWLRKISLDELPNFWNVITGDMALVGPRPEIPEMLPYYKGEMLKKFSVRPGVTGLAQVSGRGRLGFYDTVELDLEYIRNRSFTYDLKILYQTLKQVLLGDGAF